MKLTGCNKTQFTCDDGQCVTMEERCNQIPDCDDESDELNCKILKLKEGYNKRVPPVSKTSKKIKTLKPVAVNVSLTLFKIVAIKEDDHSIQLQFQILPLGLGARVRFAERRRRPSDMDITDVIRVTDSHKRPLKSPRCADCLRPRKSRMGMHACTMQHRSCPRSGTRGPCRFRLTCVISI